MQFKVSGTCVKTSCVFFSIKNIYVKNIVNAEMWA